MGSKNEILEGKRGLQKMLEDGRVSYVRSPRVWNRNRLAYTEKYAQASLRQRCMVGRSSDACKICHIDREFSAARVCVFRNIMAK